MHHYSASMKHNESTIRQLAKVQYNIFGIRIKLILFLLACIWLYFGMFSSTTTGFAKIICLMCGCFTAVSLDLPAKRNADKILECLGENTMETNYEFSQSGFTLDCTGEENAESSHIPYTSILRLVEDRTHFYLFISKFGAYMIDKATLYPDADEFRDFMESVCGQKWTRASGLFGLSWKKLKSI